MHWNIFLNINVLFILLPTDDFSNLYLIKITQFEILKYPTNIFLHSKFSLPNYNSLHKNIQL